MDKPKVTTKKRSKKSGDVKDTESTDVSVALWGSSYRVEGEKAVVDSLTTSDLNRLRWQLMVGNHQDRTKAKAWLEKRKLTANNSTRA